MDAHDLPRVHHRRRFASDPAEDRRISPPPPWITHPQTSSAPPCLSRAPSVAPFAMSLLLRPRDGDERSPAFVDRASLKRAPGLPPL
uniref:Uncharacterized protein n=1 Tax=Triticum urartu TaxID=4572 RepID=A0A8R7R433_TRIUA